MAFICGWIACIFRIDDRALVTQREHHQVDEDGQDDDRPAVVAGEPYSHFRAPSSGTTSHANIPKLIAWVSSGSSACSVVELLGADEELIACAGVAG